MMAQKYRKRGMASFVALGVLLSSSALPAEESATVFIGMCDASAAAAVDSDRFVVADDEDNILRVYSRSTGGAALSETDVSEFLGNQGKKKPKEADLEAAAQLGDHVFWIASHGRNSKGKATPERQRLFATTARSLDGKPEIAPVGKPYSALLTDLTAHPALAKYDLSTAAGLAPKAPGGLNIEGLASTPEGHLLIGFRSPARGGKALVVPLLNPLEVIKGGGAKLGDPIELDLQGLGIRSIERVGDRYVIIAGSTGDAPEPARVFEWSPKGAPRRLEGVTLSGLNPEGVSFHRGDGTGEHFILSDDGTREVEGRDCKDLKDPSMKRFRGRALAF